MSAQMLPHRPIAIVMLAAAALMLGCAQSSADMPAYEKVTIQKGELPFKGTAEDCPPEGICTCTADIEKLQFKGSDAATQKINQTLAQAVAPLCSADLASSASSSTLTHNSNQFASVVMSNLPYGRFAGGSCHGEMRAMTFDRATGQELKLKDIVAPKDLPQLAKNFAHQIVARQGSDAVADFTSEAEIAEKIAEYKGNIGVYIQSGKAHAQLSEFFFSCADGNNFPAQIPTTAIQHKALRAALNAN